MSEEEKETIDFFIHECEKYDGTIEIKGTSVGEETRILNTIVKFLKELNSLKEIEQAHQEENGKLRVELEQEKEMNEKLQNEIMEKELLIGGMKEERRIAIEEIREEYYISKDKIKDFVSEKNETFICR